MRPDPERDYAHTADSGRIIYLGDVRRRRASRGHALPDRHYVAAIAAVAGIGWAIWLTVLFTVPPSKFLTYLAFIAPLALSIGATATLVAFALESRTEDVPSLTRSIRRGSFLSVIVAGNFVLLTAHRWSVPALIGLLLVLLLLDVAREHRRHYRVLTGRPPRN